MKNIIDRIIYENIDAEKEQSRIPYSVLLSMDFEGLLGSPEQLDRFKELWTNLDILKSTVMPIGSFVEGKTNQGWKTWKDEGEAIDFEASLRDYSSWSDDHRFLEKGKTSDTRWTGLRRKDSLIIGLGSGANRRSMIWKQGFNTLILAINRRLRHDLVDLFGKSRGGNASKRWPKELKGLVLAYNRVVFKDLYKAMGVNEPDKMYHELLDETMGSNEELKTAMSYAIRGYYEALMANRSCPRFWENIDTRVTFQNIMFGTCALTDLLKAWETLGNTEKAKSTFQFIFKFLINFRENYSLFKLPSLFGLKGWEVTEEAWLNSISSRINKISPYNVVRRGALYVLVRELNEKYLKKLEYNPAKVVADTGHISGEAHGIWENRDWCEDRTI